MITARRDPWSLFAKEMPLFLQVKHTQLMAECPMRFDLSRREARSKIRAGGGCPEISASARRRPTCPAWGDLCSLPARKDLWEFLLLPHSRVVSLDVPAKTDEDAISDDDDDFAARAAYRGAKRKAERRGGGRRTEEGEVKDTAKWGRSDPERHQ